METKIFKIYDAGDRQIDEVAGILRSGGTAALPTETVYGLAADAFNEGAVRRIFEAKGRPADNPLIVHIAESEQLSSLAEEVPDMARPFLRAFWPGPFTAIFKKKAAVPSVTSGGLPSVAVRCPQNAIFREIIKKSGCLLAAPSANLSGSPSPTTARHVVDDLNGRVDAIVCSYDCGVGVESTVVSFLEDRPRLLRPGGITVEQLRELSPDLVVDEGVLHTVERALSPGMKYKHYAPKCAITAVEGESPLFCRFANEKGLPVLCFEEDEPNLRVPFISLGRHAERHLFTALRELDEQGHKRALAHLPDKNGVGLAVYNRLIRAAAFNTISLPVVIGLTGPSGAGKTTVAAAAEGLGFYVIDCDRVAKDTAPQLIKQLTAAFSDEILCNGQLDRRALAARAFRDRQSTELLNSIMLPPIVKNINSLIKKSGRCRVLLDGATLYEAGADRDCTAVIAVLAPWQKRLERFKRRDGLSDSEAEARLSAAKPDDFYTSRTGYILRNDGDIKELEKNAKEMLKRFV